MSQALRISDLEKTNTGPVWVINNTEGSDRSILVLSVPKLNGDGNDSVVIPVTWVPVDLTEQVPKRQLLLASDFRRAVGSRAMVLVTEESAEKTRREPGAIQEIARLAAEARSVTSASARLTTGSADPEAASSGLSARVQQFMVTMEDATDAGAVLNTLRSMGRLAEPELRAISALATTRRFNEVATFCEEQIEKA